MTDIAQKIPIFKIPDVAALPDEYIAQKITDEIGGVGAQYSVPIGSYATFKAAVNGRGYDIDNYYGWQCWDGAALLWQQLGLSLLTGNGLAIGCWDLEKNINKYDKFNLISKINDLKVGDVVVMRPNHIGFFDGFDGSYMKILGQNQGIGTPNKNGGYAFSVARVTKTAFAGAFRFKQWYKEKDMLTKNELIQLRRHYTGQNPTAAEIKKYVGKVTQQQMASMIWTWGSYKNAIAKAKAGTLDPVDFLPGSISKVYKKPSTPTAGKVDKAAVVDYIKKNLK